MTYRAPAVGAAFLLWLAPGCSATSGPSMNPPDTVSLSFDQSGVLALAPGQVTSLGISGMNLDQVALSLAGNYLDAALNSDAINLVDGHGSFTLHAPSTASTFSVFAVAGMHTARLDIAVSSSGFATVRVTLDYMGTRSASEVAASAFVETTCASLGGAPVDGSPLIFGLYGDPLVIPDVPTDAHVAVNVRIGHYAVGCADVSVTANQTSAITVPVFDLPLDLKDSTLQTRTAFTPSSTQLSALVGYFAQTVTPAVVKASYGQTGGEASTLLTAMGSASTSPSAFETARSSNGWDAAVGSWLASRAPTLSSRAAKWIAEATQGGTGDLTGQLAGDPSMPIFTPKTLGVVDANLGGVTASNPFTWSGGPNDSLSIAGSVTINPSQFACALADVQAESDVPSSTGVASALGSQIDCGGMGSAMMPTGFAYSTCDAVCLAGLCTEALANLWQAGAQSLSSASDALDLTMVMSTSAQIADTPAVISFAGNWVGSFGSGSAKYATAGTVKAATGTTPN